MGRKRMQSSCVPDTYIGLPCRAEHVFGVRRLAELCVRVAAKIVGAAADFAQRRDFGPFAGDFRNPKICPRTLKGLS